MADLDVAEHAFLLCSPIGPQAPDERPRGLERRRRAVCPPTCVQGHASALDTLPDTHPGHSQTPFGHAVGHICEPLRRLLAALDTLSDTSRADHMIGSMRLSRLFAHALCTPNLI